MRLDLLSTPCALVDLEVAERNARRFRGRAEDLGVRLRPHVKTHKCVPAARLQVAGGEAAITVSTMAEARHFAAAGFRDMVWAVPVDPARLDQVAGFGDSDTRCAIVVDHAHAVEAATTRASSLGTRFEVFVKVDCGGGRAGLDPGSDSAVAFVRRVQRSPGLVLRGLLTHAGNAYRCRDRDQVAAVARVEREALLLLAEKLREQGLEVAELSLGSTPTFAAVDDLRGIDEARPGNYLFFDLFQEAIGSCTRRDLAFAVLATVIGHYPERGELLINAGALALSRDPGPVHVDPECGFGRLSSAGGDPLPGLRVVSLTQEHGLVRADQPAHMQHLRIGSLVRVLPNHACLAAACFDRYHVHREGVVVDEWQPVRGW